jgi:terminal uridylyltransferase
MDLVVLIDDEAAGIEPSHFVAMMGDLLERVRSATLLPISYPADRS